LCLFGVWWQDWWLGMGVDACSFALLAGEALQCLNSHLPCSILTLSAQRHAVSPIFKAAMDVLEGHIAAMHKQRWGGGPAGATPTSTAAAEPGAAANGDSADAGGGDAVIETSGYVTDLANAIAVFRCGLFVLCSCASSGAAVLLPHIKLPSRHLVTSLSPRHT
jgi:hypothetical protein